MSVAPRGVLLRAGWRFASCRGAYAGHDQTKKGRIPMNELPDRFNGPG